MRAFEITAGTTIRPLPLPSAYRTGDVPAEHYRRQATGEVPTVVPNLSPAVVAGALTLTTSGGRKTTLFPGDLFLVDELSAAHIGVSARDNCRLVQVGVEPEWPGPEAKVQGPGTLTRRDAGAVRIKRIYKGGGDDLAYCREFAELFSAPPNEWSAPRPVAGLRFMCWENGFIDWHPEVVNNLALFLSGELEVETSGDRLVNVFHAGDVCLTEDRTGVGHIVRCRGVTHIALVVMNTKDLW